MKNLKLMMGALCLVLMAACSNYKYYSVGSNTANLQKYRTFALLPSMNRGNDPNFKDLADQTVSEATTDQLEAKGLTLKVRNPDLLVRPTIMVKEKVKTYSQPVYDYVGGGYYPRVIRYRGGRALYYAYSAPFPVYAGDDIQEVPFNEGTLILDLIDRRTRKIIWRGYGVGEVNNPQRAIDDIPKVVKGIMNKLPLSSAQ